VWTLWHAAASFSVMAGVVGKKKFTYDLWGDAVNVAALMESKGTAGRIIVSESTWHRAKNTFSCEHRGRVTDKNDRLQDTYYLDAA
jgi:adenylate cyclase